MKRHRWKLSGLATEEGGHETAPFHSCGSYTSGEDAVNKQLAPRVDNLNNIIITDFESRITNSQSEATEHCLTFRSGRPTLLCIDEIMWKL